MEGINTLFVIDEHTAIVMTDPQNVNEMRQR